MALRFEGEGLLRQSLTLLRACGSGRNECVVLWVGAASDREVVTRVVHPMHTSHRGGYQIDGTWLNDFWMELARNEERVLAQVHTHPRDAFHSRTDDRSPILVQAGLYSVVIPNFASEPIGESQWFVARLEQDGSWETLAWREVAR